jgi:hypothetical protein
MYIFREIEKNYFKITFLLPVYKTGNAVAGIRHADHVAHSIYRSWH